jgi:hypothetical protein
MSLDGDSGLESTFAHDYLVTYCLGRLGELLVHPRRPEALHRLRVPSQRLGPSVVSAA